MGYLPHEGGEVGVPKIFGQYFASEADHINNDKSYVVLVPTNDLLIFGMLATARGTYRI